MTDLRGPSRQETLQRTDKGYSQAFTTEPKTRRFFWHKQVVVKTRATVLQESFYPTKDVPYEAVRVRMATLLGIVDRASVLAYLGRPQHYESTLLDHTVRYQSGAIVRKQHNIRRRLLARKGYIEQFGLGYVYARDGEWWVHWFHSEQASLQSYQGEVVDDSEASKVDFSLSHIAIADNEKPEANEDVETIEKRESESLRERNFASESILHDSSYAHHTELLRKYQRSEST